MVQEIFGPDGGAEAIHLDDFSEHRICGRTGPSQGKHVDVLISDLTIDNIV